MEAYLFIGFWVAVVHIVVIMLIDDSKDIASVTFVGLICWLLWPFALMADLLGLVTWGVGKVRR